MMEIQIYQINQQRDQNLVCFLRYDALQRFQGTQKIDSKIYDLVFSGRVDCNDLEEVFAMFNNVFLEQYPFRSLSVSDIIGVLNADNGKFSYYYCDMIGFQSVEFQPEKSQESRPQDEKKGKKDGESRQKNCSRSYER